MNGETRAEDRSTEEDPSIFDELCIDDWLHLEQMSKRTWWMDLGGYHLWMRIEKDGTCAVPCRGKVLTDYGLEKDR